MVPREVAGAGDGDLPVEVTERRLRLPVEEVVMEVRRATARLPPEDSVLRQDPRGRRRSS